MTKTYCNLTHGVGAYLLLLLFFWPQSDGYNQPERPFPKEKKVRNLPPVVTPQVIVNAAQPGIDSMIALKLKQQAAAEKKRADDAEAALALYKKQITENTKKLANRFTHVDIRPAQNAAEQAMDDSLMGLPKDKAFFSFGKDTIFYNTTRTITNTIRPFRKDLHDTTVTISISTSKP